MKKWVRIIAISKTLSEVKRELGSKDALQFAHHCAKLSICRPNDINIEHWKKELYGFCFGIQQIKIKPNNKWISKKLIDEYYFNAYCDFEDTYALALNDAWQELKLNNTYGERNKLNDNRLFNQYRTLCNEVSTYLSKHELTQNVINSLVDKYILNLYWNLEGNLN